MQQDRRDFLKLLAAACAGGITRNLGVGAVAAGSAALGANAAGATATAATTITAMAATGVYAGSGIRGQVLEVIVRQAMAGAPWKQICAGPLKVNGITEAEVEEEIARRKNLLQSGIKVTENKVLERWRKHQATLDAIRHSEKSPCACRKCVVAINKIHRFDPTE